MRRVNSTSKNMTNVGQQGNPAVPSLANPGKQTNFKIIPLLNNFVKSPSVLELDARKIGIYKLKKYNIKINKQHTQTQLILTYRLKKTRYKVYSFTLATVGNGKKNIEGRIEISKGLFKQKEFKLQELPANIVSSINENIVKFNEAYDKTLINLKERVKVKITKKKLNFFKGLDV